MNKKLPPFRGPAPNNTSLELSSQKMWVLELNAICDFDLDVHMCLSQPYFLSFLGFVLGEKWHRV